MTYGDLLKALNEMPVERLNDTAIVHLVNHIEAVQVDDIREVNSRHALDGVLDQGHFVLEVDF